MNGQSKDGWSALMFAANHGHTEAVRALLAKGADVSVVSTDGKSPFVLAQEQCHTAIIHLLTQAEGLRREPAETNLVGLTVRIVYVPRRKADATRAAEKLGNLGVKVDLREATDRGIEAHFGKLYYHLPCGSDVAHEVARKVSGIEEVIPSKFNNAPEEGTRPHLILWIVK